MSKELENAIKIAIAQPKPAEELIALIKEFMTRLDSLESDVSDIKDTLDGE